MDTTIPTWYLMKHDDGTVFGPVTFEQLKSWAASAQISPLDRLSDDQSEWNRAPTYPDLGMDWLVQSSPGQLYGPTTVGAVKEFIAAGEITLESTAINCVSGEEVPVRQIPELKAEEVLGGREVEEPGKASTKENLQQRIRDLEEVIVEERNLRRAAEEKYDKMAARYRAATGNEP